MPRVFIFIHQTPTKTDGKINYKILVQFWDNSKVSVAINVEYPYMLLYTDLTKCKAL